MRSEALQYFSENLRDKVIINKSINIPIILSFGVGGKKTYRGGAIYGKKSEIVRVLDILIHNAEYNNWGSPKKTDNENVIGYLNFKAKVYLDDTLENIRLSVQFQKGGKYYYNFEVNKIKNE